MITIGLTGSIGMGKSTVAAMFEELGVPVFDADAAVRRLQGPGGALIAPIEAAFPGTTGPQGVDRAALSKVLHDPEALKRLEAIVHPAVGEARVQFLQDHATAPIVVFDIPLLFETGGDNRVDVTVVVSAPPELQRKRVLARDGMTPDKFAAILARQMPDAEKRSRADHVIDTGVPLDETRAQVSALVEGLSAQLGGG
ncbi:MAG TPA: dephospho-CoA kinase [Sphingomonas sp.]|jgi:dephospho-CoA kinase|nr:dephospho-CoA kinase [Sphingomonas sp.]